MFPCTGVHSISFQLLSATLRNEKEHIGSVLGKNLVYKYLMNLNDVYNNYYIILMTYIL